MTNPESRPLPLVRRYFPAASDEQYEKLCHLGEVVREWNEYVNLISRKDIENLEERHILHSLAIARVWMSEDHAPAAGTTVADLGTGGGFPGTPLAILFPEVEFTLIDFVGKKAHAVNDMTGTLGLANVEVVCERAENITQHFDIVLGRAVSRIPQFLESATPLLKRDSQKSQAHGIYYFKGTHFREELADHPTQPTHVWELNTFFEEPFFAEKFLLQFSDG